MFLNLVVCGLMMALALQFRDMWRQKPDSGGLRRKIKKERSGDIGMTLSIGSIKDENIEEC